MFTREIRLLNKYSQVYFLMFVHFDNQLLPLITSYCLW